MSDGLDQCGSCRASLVRTSPVPVKLYRVPAEKGLFVFGASDYTPLRIGQLSGTSSPIQWNYPGSTETYAVETGEFVPIEGTELTLLDSDGRVPLIYGVGPQGVILKHEEFMGRAKNTAIVIHDDSVVQIAPGIKLRKVKLAKGKWVFCNPSSGSKIAYLLEVK